MKIQTPAASDSCFLDQHQIQRRHSPCAFHLLESCTSESQSHQVYIGAARQPVTLSNINVTVAFRVAPSPGAEPITKDKRRWCVSRETGQQGPQWGGNPTGTQVATIFNIQGQAIVHNAGNVLAHPGRYLSCKQFCSETVTSKWRQHKLQLTFVIPKLPLRRWKRWCKLSSKLDPSLVSLLWKSDNGRSIAPLVILCEVSANPWKL